MGRFFTNVHVRPSERCRDPRGALVAALDTRAASDGLHAVGPHERFDRLVAIGPSGSSTWIAVADEATESQNEGALEDLARTLSRAIDGYAVSVLVHDSDVLDLRLFEKGTQLDRYVSQPEYFSEGTLTTGARRAVQGHARTWAPLLRDAESIDALEAAFKSTPRFAEETLDTVARLLGFDRGYDLGAGDLRQEPAPGFELRRFARPTTTSPAAAGPPAFTAGNWMTSLTLTVGEPLHWSSGVLNAGGPAHGVAIGVAGSAVERGLIRVTRAACAVPLGGHDVERATRDLDVLDGRASAEFPDLRVPAPNPELAAPQVIAMLEGRVEREGLGKLAVTIRPLDAPDRGLSQVVDVSIGPALARPLKAVDASAGQSLRAMETPATLVAIVAMRSSQDRAALECADAMVRWIRIVAGPARASFSTTTYGAGRPKRGRFSSKDLPDGDAWRVVRTDMLGEGGVYVQTRVDLKAPGAADVVMKPTHGAAFHVSHLPRDTAPLSPHLGLWFDIRATKAPDIERVKTALVEIVDGIVRAGHAHQAFLARWDWRPALTLDATPYELACGVHGQCTTRHSWVERYLHAVADVVWLGPTLRERLPGFQAPEGTSAMAIGSALRVTCGDAGAVRAFERAVAPLLPGADDWKNALMGSR